MLMQQQATSPDFSVRGFASKCNVSERHVRECISRGKIPSYRVGSTLRIPAEAVEMLRSGRADGDDLDAHVDAIVASWPALSDEQLDRIAALLRSDQPNG
jgi:excisionase family DNA binding protein